MGLTHHARHGIRLELPASNVEALLLEWFAGDGNALVLSTWILMRAVLAAIGPDELFVARHFEDLDHANLSHMAKLQQLNDVCNEISQCLRLYGIF